MVTANPDATFSPVHVTIWQNDQVNFRNAGGVHNVIADDNRFHCGVNCNTNWSPSAALWNVRVQFTRVGEFGYFCEQHGDTMIGMRGSITVLDRVFVDGFEEAAPPAGLQADAAPDAKPDAVVD